MKDWDKFIVTFLLTLIVFGIINDLSRPISCTSVGENIDVIIIVCAVSHTLSFLLPFVIGLVISLLISLGEKADNKKSVAKRFLRGLYISIPIAIYIIYLNFYTKNINV